MKFQEIFLESVVKMFDDIKPSTAITEDAISVSVGEDENYVTVIIRKEPTEDSFKVNKSVLNPIMDRLSKHDLPDWVTVSDVRGGDNEWNIRNVEVHSEIDPLYYDRDEDDDED